MRFALIVFLSLSFLAVPAWQYAQNGPPRDRDMEDKQPPRLPNGRTQRDEILKADYGHNIEDVGEIVRLAEDLKANLEKNTQYVFSLQDVKRLDDIEKLTRRIRSRMKRY
jgi:hypothetical protein